MRFALFVGSVVVGSMLFVSTNVRAAVEDCPPGSISKSENGFSWCEPTVCENDGQCKPDEVCRPIPLCMQIGAVAGDAASPDAAAKRLVVTQRCAPDKTCPQTTTCSDLRRCVSKIAADKMGILSTPMPGSTAEKADNPTPAKKSCGCGAVGTKTEGGLFGLAAIASVMFAARRRARSRRG